MRLAWLTLSCLVSACSWVVSGEPDELRCSLEGALGPPACDPGFRCISGVCRADSGVVETASGAGGAPAIGDSGGGSAGAGG
jgi:hypothetical protein